jgi:hypothetical protein
MASETVSSLEASFPLLQDAGTVPAPAAATGAAPTAQPSLLDEDIAPEETYVSVDDLFGPSDDADGDEE